MSYLANNRNLDPHAFPTDLCNISTLRYIYMPNMNLQGSLPDNCAGASSWLRFNIENNKLNRDANNNRLEP